MSSNPKRHGGFRALRVAVQFVLLAVLVSDVHAQAASRAAGADARIGVVLSGGAAKGFAHIGVLRVLEDAGVPIAVITGTSMGALVGGLRASGLSPAEIEEIATGIDWTRLVNDAPERGQLFPDRRSDADRTVVTLPFSSGRPQLPAGVVSGRNIHRLIARLTWPVQAIRDFARLPVPFAAVATDLETGEPVRLDGGVLADALRATMSIPGFLEPVRLDARLLVDGGLIRNLPARDALDLGADYLICSDVTDPLAQAENLASAVDVLLQTVSFRMVASTAEQQRLCDVLIRPDISGLSSFSFEDAAEWIDRGVTAAERVLPQLQALVASRAAASRTSMAGPRLPESVRVGRIDVRGVEGKPRQLAVRALALEPGPITAEHVDRAVGRLYSTELFSKASWHIGIEGVDTTLVIDVSAATNDQVGFGFRYDDRYKAALLFTADLYNLLDYGSMVRLELRLGEQLLLEGRFARGRGLSTPLTVGGELSLARLPLHVYENGNRVAEIRTSLIRSSFLLGSTVGRSAAAGIHGGFEHSLDETAISPADSVFRKTLATGGVQFRLEAFDQTPFPTRGVSMLARTQWATTLSGPGAFFKHFADVRAAVPIAGTMSVLLRAYAGVARGDVPYHHLFFLGGSTAPGVFSESQPTFDGLNPQARRGKAIQAIWAGLQWEPRPQLFATARVNAGATAERWAADLRDYSAGWALSLGTVTLAGPVEATLESLVHGRSKLHISIGHSF